MGLSDLYSPIKNNYTKKGGKTMKDKMIVKNNGEIILQGFEHLNETFFFKMFPSGIILANDYKTNVPVFIEKTRNITNKHLLDFIERYGITKGMEISFLYYPRDDVYYQIVI